MATEYNIQVKAFDQLASEGSISSVVAALSQHNIDAVVVNDAAEAKAKFFELLPKGASIMTMTSQTLLQAGILEELEQSGVYQLVKDRLKVLNDDSDAALKRQLGAAPDWATGSLHAITESGQLMWASQTGSQLPAYAYGAKKVILVASTKKIVEDLERGLSRIYEYSLPLEAERAKVAYGASGSSVSKILIINSELQADRIKLILVKQDLGF